MHLHGKEVPLSKVLNLTPILKRIVFIYSIIAFTWLAEIE